MKEFGINSVIFLKKVVDKFYKYYYIVILFKKGENLMELIFRIIKKVLFNLMCISLIFTALGLIIYLSHFVSCFFFVKNSTIILCTIGIPFLILLVIAVTLDEMGL